MSDDPKLPSALGMESPRRFALGGMAELFKAHKVFPDGGRAELVVKRMLPQHLATDDLVSRFRDEARLGLLLHHSNIVRVLEYWEIEGQQYLVMEEIEGVDVGRLLRTCREQERQMPQEVVAFFLHGIASALAYMVDVTTPGGASLGLVHRDISPSNILVSYGGVIKLIDFGVSKAAEREARTRTGYFVGKYSYMSPEQIRGLDLDIRADLFALGAVGYEMLTNTRAFRGTTEYETFNMVLHEHPRPIDKTRPGTHPRLITVIDRCLAKDPTDRYAHPQDLVEDLNEYYFEEVSRPPALLARTFLAELGHVATAGNDGPGFEQTRSSTTPLEDPGPPATLPDFEQDLVVSLDGPSTVTPTPPPARPRESRRLWWAGAIASVVLVLVLLVGLAVAFAKYPRSNNTKIADTIRSAEPPQETVTATTTPNPGPVVGDTEAEADTDTDPDVLERADVSEVIVTDEEPTPPPLAYGALGVQSIPWAEVHIDGRSIGQTPISSHRLPVGRYRLQASNPELHWTHETTIDIRQGQTEVIQLHPISE